METLNIKALDVNTEQMKAIEEFFKKLKIRFEFSKEESGYDEEFVEKIQQGDEDIKNGNVKSITLDELDALWK
ncbi:DUF2683 family protein [Cruoricaptor ignavus]|uniref:DUF2683 family protein n=1 Tax=Cruoricaptor ignavus TaxID=1118202 RepID=UPI00370DC34D